MAEEFCVIHGALEAVTGKSVQCFECKHVFPSERSVVMDWNALQQRMAEQADKPHPFEEFVKLGPYEPRILTDVADVPFCPHCLHDF